MGFDPFSPIAPARVRCLVLPCGRITRSKFASCLERLQQENVVRLGDVSPDGRPYRNMFSPLAFPAGIVVYDLITWIPTTNQINLVPLELHRMPLAVVAIADARKYITVEHMEAASDSDSTNVKGRDGEVENSRYDLGELVQFADGLTEQYPSALLHQILVFDCDQACTPPINKLRPIPSPEKSRTTTMKTVMCDLTSHLLAEMTTYAKSIQAWPTIDTPKASHNEKSTAEHFVRPLSQDDHPSRPQSRISDTLDSRSSSPADGRGRYYSRPSSPAQSMYTATPATRNDDQRLEIVSDGARTPPVTFDDINGLPGRPAQNTEKANSKQTSKDRISVNGFGPGSIGERARNKVKGRLGVILGSMYLLAGRWPDAIKELVESALVTRVINDHIWHAKALEYILVCLLMSAWAGMDFDIPQVCYPSGDKSSLGSNRSAKLSSTNSMPDPTIIRSSDTANRLLSLQNLCNLLPDLVNTILRMYVRAATFTSEQLPQLAFSDSVIRFANLLAIIQSCHGVLDDHVLQRVVVNERAQKSVPHVPLQFRSFPTKSEIVAILFGATPSLASEQSMTITEKVNIFAGIASVLLTLDYKRKKAFVLREILGLLHTDLIQSRKDNAAAIGVHPATSSAFLGSAQEILSSFESNSRQPDSDYGFHHYLWLLCEVYGTTAPTSHELAKSESAEPAAIRALQDARLRSFGNQDLKLSVLWSCVRISESLPDVKGIFKFSATLLRTAGTGIAPEPGGSTGHPNLPLEDQARLSAQLQRIANMSFPQDPIQIDTNYWDEFLVRQVDLVPLPPTEAPVLQQKNNVGPSSGSVSLQKDGPFIYNPFLTKSSATSKANVLVAKHEATFNVVLQNLYDFDLEIERIQLASTGVEMKMSSRRAVIGPYRTQTLSLTGTPQSAGDLRISGCLVKVRGCEERRFPIFVKAWKEFESCKLKNIGLAAAEHAKEEIIFHDPSKARSSSQLTRMIPIESTLKLDVIAPQPEVVVKGSSLAQSAIMLLEGETKTLSITLQNVSSEVVVDLLLISFSDSTKTSLESAIADKALSVAELYEFELVLFHHEALSWKRSDKGKGLLIVPGGEASILVEVVGRQGLNQGIVHVDYGRLGDHTTDLIDSFYTRQVSLPMTITVHPSVELIRNEFLPFTGDFAWRNQRHYPLPNGNAVTTSQERRSRATSRITKTENRFQALLERLGLGSHGNEHCILLLDFYNAWMNPLSISVQVRDNTLKDVSPGESWKRAYTVHEVIQPGHTSRLVLILPRIWLENPYALIPSLNPIIKRQYVVSSSTASMESERASREAFWFREEVLNHMRATWEEESTGRHGYIELRALHLTSSMVHAIKLEEVGIEIYISGTSRASPQVQSPTSLYPKGDLTQIYQSGRSTFRIPVDTSVILRTKITNRLAHPISSLLRLQPCLRHQPPFIALDMAKKFAFNGLLQRTLPRLLAGEVREIELGCMFLCSGDFEIHASVEESRLWKQPCAAVKEGGGNGRPGAETGELGFGLGVDVRTERRVWSLREPCIVSVVDSLEAGGDGDIVE